MGQIFSGEMEDFLLYCAIPMALLGFFTAMGWLEARIGAHLRRHEPGWRGVLVPSDAALFRSQAADPGRAPREVLVLIRVLYVWGVGVGLFWAGAALLVAQRSWWLALIAFGFGIAASVRLVMGAFTLCDREDRGARPQIAHLRTWLAVHHGVVFLLGTGLFFLFMLSNQFFWNGASDHRVGQLMEFAVLYAFVVLLPTGLGALLAQRLRRVWDLYPPAKVPVTADPMPG